MSERPAKTVATVSKSPDHKSPAKTQTANRTKDAADDPPSPFANPAPSPSSPLRPTPAIPAAIPVAERTTPEEPVPPEESAPAEEPATPVSSPGGELPPAATLEESTVAGSSAQTPAADAPQPIVFFQELQMRKSSRFAMEGLTVPQQVEYLVLSEFVLQPPSQEGLRQAVQTVLDTRLVSADETAKTTFTQALRDLVGKKLTYTLDGKGEVVDFKAEKAEVKAAPLAAAGGVEALGGLGALEGLAAGLGAGGDVLGADGFRVASVMDDDGWQELAEYTFFQPDQKLAPGHPERRQRTHDWGALGVWTGETQFQWRKEQRNIVQIAFAHSLKHGPPVGKKGGLPFDVASAEFAPPLGRGMIYYDNRQRRVAAIEEEFAARGIVAANLLGQSARVQIEEQQAMALRITDQNPWRQ